MRKDSRIIILTGHSGSGKTEVAINYAISLNAEKKVAIVDLDIVNPYFRSREVKDLLKEQSITVVAPEGVAKHADIPALSPFINGMIENEEYTVIFDVGGDEMGARALGRFHKKLEQKGYNMSLVVNPFRPSTCDVESITTMLNNIEEASCLKVTSLIANPHLGIETDYQQIIDGYKIVLATSKVLNLPIKFVSIKEDILSEFKQKNYIENLLPLKLFMLPPWIDRV